MLVTLQKILIAISSEGPHAATYRWFFTFNLLLVPRPHGKKSCALPSGLDGLCAHVCNKYVNNTTELGATDLWRRARCHVDATASGLCRHITYLGAITYGAELCYLGAIGYGAEQRVQKCY
jgi:hypothetical protein